MRKIYLILIIICPILFFSQSKKGFYLPDTLKTKSFDYLKKGYDKEFQSKKNLAELYANCLLLKGKKEKNDLKTIDGYISLYRLKGDDLSALSYLDSMMIVSKKINNKEYLSDGYMYKGNYYYLKGDYLKSLGSYLEARNYAENNSETYHILNFNIGLLKLELGNYQEAQNLFFDFKKYIEYKGQTKRIDYVSCLYAIAYTYNKTNMIDLSESFVKLGLKANEQIKDQESYLNLLLVSGINSYKRKNYKEAIEKLEKVDKLTRKNSYNLQNLALSEFYIGKSLNRINDAKFLNKFKTVDSIIFKTKNVTSELREIYPFLIEHYKENNDKQKQLLYIEHLLTFDSISSSNKYNLSTIINKKYDTPNLIIEKEKLISDLNSKNSTLFWIIGIIGLLTISLIIIYYKNRKQIKFYERQAEALLKNSKDIVNIEDISINTNSWNIGKEEVDKPKSSLPEDIIENLRLKFTQFENEKGFLNKSLTLDNLAKDFETNRDYLSKMVNELKGKNFSQYINELRINNIVEELKNNPHLQKYTIAGIAEEAGYNNSESFTNSFKKHTGTLPSYYIKALQEKKNEIL